MTVSANITIYARWAVSYAVTIVTLVLNDGSDNRDVGVLTGHKIIIPDNIRRANYDIEGWYSASDLTTGKWDFNVIPTRPFTLYCKWVPKVYTVTLDPNGGTWNPTAPGEANAETTKVASWDIKHGDNFPSSFSRISMRYAHATFDGWTNTDTGATKVTFVDLPVTKEVTYQAQWKRTPYTLTLDKMAQDSPKTTVVADAYTPIPLPSGNDYKYRAQSNFEGFYESADFSGKQVTFPLTITKNMTIYAKMTATVTFVSPVGKPQFPPITVTRSFITSPHTVIAGNPTLEGWYDNPRFLNYPFNFGNQIIHHVTIYAKWVDDGASVKVDYGLGAPGGVTPYTVKYSGFVPPHTAAPSGQDPSEWTFAGFYHDGAFTRKVTDATVRSLSDGDTIYGYWREYPSTKSKLQDIILKRTDPNITYMGRLGSATANLNHIDTSRITDMSYLFFGDIAFSNSGPRRVAYRRVVGSFDGNISKWDTSNVTNMRGVFFKLATFNSNLDSWDTSNVKNMYAMFYLALTFNQSISNWDTSSVTNMSGMFQSAKAYNQSMDTRQVTHGGRTYTSWNVSSVTDMSQMFHGAKALRFNAPNWDVSSVTDMRSMFKEVDTVDGLLQWDTSSVTDMSNMFEKIKVGYIHGNISNWNTSKVQSMSGMFKDNKGYYDAATFSYQISKTHADLLTKTVGNRKAWDVSSVERMGGMFSNTSVNPRIANWDTSSLKSAYRMFAKAIVFNRSIGSWNMFNVYYAQSMFQGARWFNQDLSRWTSRHGNYINSNNDSMYKDMFVGSAMVNQFSKYPSTHPDHR